MAFRGGGFNPKGEDNFFQSGGDRHKNRRYSINRHNFSNAYVKITLLFVVIGLIRFLLNRSDYSMQLLQKPPSLSSTKHSSQRNLSPSREKLAFSFHEFKSEGLASHENDENNLENTLNRAAMKDDKTVIITALNAAWIEPNSIFDLFLESFRIGIETKSLLKHLVVAAFDQKAYSRCLEVHPHCFAVTTGGVDFSGNARIMSSNYLKMIWRRIDFLRSVLEMGYNFIFTDADVMWLRDPFQRFYPDGDLQVASDRYKHNSTNPNNLANGGFVYVKSNYRTIQFYKFWYSKKDDIPRKHDQDVFNTIKSDPFIKEIGLEIRFLDTAYFGGLCIPSKDLDVVVTMHANCCTRLKNKIHDIKMVLEDWKKYVDEDEKKSLSSRSWSAPWKCGLNESSN